MEPRFFASPSEFREWLEAHHASETEIYVGYHKRHTKAVSITWPESVDQALCFGWIDGMRKSIDDDRYFIRFTPRKPRSIWSKINLKRIEELKALGLVSAAGLKAYQTRDPSKANKYSFENEEKKLSPEFEEEFRKNEKAWAYFQSQPPSFRKTVSFLVMSPKREETRRTRLQGVIESSERGEWPKQLRWGRGARAKE